MTLQATLDDALHDASLGRQVGTAEWSEQLEAKFWTFHAAHPAVYLELVRLARAARAAGVDRLGIAMLWERLRWSISVEGLPAGGEAYKLNNSYRSRYARLIMDREPDLSGVFETRGLRS